MEFSSKGMSKDKQKALDLAEEARQTEWSMPSYCAKLFEGSFRWDLIHPYPEQTPEDKKIGDEFIGRLEAFFKEKLDADEIDRTGKIPEEVYQGLAELGCFSLKIPKEYGGMGMSQVNYNRIIGLVATYCGSTAVLLSAHQSIGAPQPLKFFGTDEQKKKYLTRFGKNRYISAFALTETEAGSDPARMITTATPADNGESFILNGEKLWCTNGPIADVIVVMAQTPPKVVRGKERKQITAFIVEKDMPGVELVHRCRFMGLKAMENGLMRFKNVKVPKENMLWDPGRGLKLALMTLNIGRLTVPAGVTAGSKRCLKIAREWSNVRQQWGQAIGKHEVITTRLSVMAATTFAMDSMTQIVSSMVDQGKTDIRLEAAIAKLFCTEAAWRIADNTMQIRGGRGYETSESLKGRGEKPIPCERMLRDFRINTIIEGTSDVMHLFIAREAMDMHLKLAAPLFSPKTGIVKKLIAFVRAGFSYAVWYPKLWVWPSRVPMEGMPIKLHRHMKYVERKSRCLARSLFHAMMLYREKLERKQLVLFRLVNIGAELFAMSASISNAACLAHKNGSEANSVELCDQFCHMSRRRIERSFKRLFSKNDDKSYGLGREVLDGKFAWMESGIISE